VMPSSMGNNSENLGRFFRSLSTHPVIICQMRATLPPSKD